MAHLYIELHIQGFLYLWLNNFLWEFGDMGLGDLLGDLKEDILSLCIVGEYSLSTSVGDGNLENVELFLDRVGLRNGDVLEWEKELKLFEFLGDNLGDGDLDIGLGDGDLDDSDLNIGLGDCLGGCILGGDLDSLSDCLGDGDLDVLGELLRFILFISIKTEESGLILVGLLSLDWIGLLARELFCVINGDGEFDNLLVGELSKLFCILEDFDPE